MTGAPRTLLITGGYGLVGSNLTRHVLATHPSDRVVVLDREAPAPVVEQFLAPYRDRIDAVHASITDAAAFDAIDASRIDVVVHGAMVAHVPEWEREQPRAYVDTNITGTANVLEWARSLPRLERFVYISTGGVYGEQSPASSETPQSEDGPLAPPELYAISKFASELLVRRYAELFSFDHRLVRLSGVFGPLERPTVSRTIMSPVCTLVHAAVAGRPLRVTGRTLESVGDHISAEDVADGLDRLARAAAPAHVAYNLAHGRLTSFRELIAAAELAGLAVEVDVVRDAQDAEIDLDPVNRRARWNAYDVRRAHADLGWKPRPLAQQIATYAGWLREREAPSS
jgi:nucleoside-diphosphate-sugar epimerase